MNSRASKDESRPRAFIELHDGRYVACYFWMVFEIDRRGDMLGYLYRDPGDEHWTFSYRHRWYADAKLWGSADKKSGYDATLPGTESEDDVAQKVLALWGTILLTYPGNVKIIEEPRVIWVRSDRATDAMQILSEQDFTSVKKFKKSDPNSS